MPRKKYQTDKDARSAAAKKAWRKRRKIPKERRFTHGGEQLPLGKYPMEVDMDGNPIAMEPQPSMPVTKTNFVMIEELLAAYRTEVETYRKERQEYNDKLYKMSVENDGLHVGYDRLVAENTSQKLLLEKAAVAFVGIFSLND